jgi:hypothetical protein
MHGGRYATAGRIALIGTMALQPPVFIIPLYVLLNPGAACSPGPQLFPAQFAAAYPIMPSSRAVLEHRFNKRLSLSAGRGIRQPSRQPASM